MSLSRVETFNRFQVFDVPILQHKSFHTSHSSAKVPDDVQFFVTLGNESIPPVSVPTMGQVCSKCFSETHASHHCPVKKCHSCMGFGHSHRICPLLRRRGTSQELSWRHSATEPSTTNA